ncbi:MAG: carboxynorspermidine decarboxylase [Pseudoflavonifractor sp.]|nr:carboxynorspermidine decarboxylase [Alloprevotella sp.]MCM1116328.1 carboxynorspermidine decarboxylase [Pseudoflavonifractor sp.]
MSHPLANSPATPYYIVYEDRLRRNLELITDVERRAGVNIIMAFKANALWKSFPIIAEYNRDFTASSLNELRLGADSLGGEAHSYCPAYTDDSIDEYLSLSTHITFNSIPQALRFATTALDRGVSTGLRVNPQCSVIDTDIYNPALPGSRFGVTAERLAAERLPQSIEGFHFHALCESSSYDLEKVLAAFEEQFGQYLPRLKWVNMGGGHLMTRQGYDTDHLIGLLRDFRRRHPNLSVILEPGSAWTWRTGDLITSVVDIVHNDGISTAIIDASFACHMPDCLEMPYKPAISEALPDVDPSLPTYRLGGNSCLSGDFVGDWTFPEPLHPGQRLTLEDMNHYTTVKTTMFNGIQHPDIILSRADGSLELLRHFTFEDYRSRMS